MIEIEIFALLPVWMFYAEGKATFQWATQTGYLVEHLKSSFSKFYGRYGDIIQKYEVSL